MPSQDVVQFFWIRISKWPPNVRILSVFVDIPYILLTLSSQKLVFWDSILFYQLLVIICIFLYRHIFKMAAKMHYFFICDTIYSSMVLVVGFGLKLNIWALLNPIVFNITLIDTRNNLQTTIWCCFWSMMRPIQI